MNRGHDEYTEYNEALNGLYFKKEAKDEMLKKLITDMEEINRGEKPKSVRRKLSRMAVAGIAAAVVLSVGAGAAVAYNKLASESFAGVFGTAHTEIVDKIGRPVGASDTDNGVTITADAIIGDKYHYAITYTIAKDDGTAFDFDRDALLGDNRFPMMFEDSDVSLRGFMGGAHGCSYFYDADPADNAIQYVVTREVSDGEVPHKAVTTTFKDLYFMDYDRDEHRLLAEGDWKIKFDLDFEDASVDLPTGQVFGQYGMEYTIDNISLSPVALRLDYTVDHEVEWDNNAKSGRVSDHNAEQEGKFLENVQIIINKTDGTTVDMSNSGGSICKGDGKTVCQKGNLFDEVIPIEDIKSVSVGSTEMQIEIPVPLS